MLGLGTAIGLENGLGLGLDLVSGMVRDSVKFRIRVRDSFRVVTVLKLGLGKGEG